MRGRPCVSVYIRVRTCVRVCNGSCRGVLLVFGGASRGPLGGGARGRPRSGLDTPRDFHPHAHRVGSVEPVRDLRRGWRARPVGGEIFLGGPLLRLHPRRAGYRRRAEPSEPLHSVSLAVSAKRGCLPASRSGVGSARATGAGPGAGREVGVEGGDGVWVAVRAGIAAPCPLLTRARVLWAGDRGSRRRDVAPRGAPGAGVDRVRGPGASDKSGRSVRPGGTKMTAARRASRGR